MMHLSPHVGAPRRSWWALSGALWLALGCSETPAPEEPAKCDLQVVSAAVISSKFINPSENGEARPVQVRIYQLKSDTGFLNSDFEAIWKDDAKALGDDLVKREEFPVYPDTRTEVKFERDEAAQFLVGAALFRNPTGKTWFTSFELPPAPSEGQCAARCPDGKCDEKPELNPKFYLWVDDTRIEDGIEYADYVPEGGAMKAEPLAEGEK